MIQPRGGYIAQNFERDLAQVQSYIQARLQPEDPHMLCLNPSLVDEYKDELQHYVQQKQRQQQVRRTLPVTPSPTNRSSSENERRPMPAKAKAATVAVVCRHESVQPPSVVPARLPTVQWLLARNHHAPVCIPDGGSDVYQPPTLPPLSSVPAFHPHFTHQRMLKKQKTM